jgi:predicted nucleic acid-binding Zn ribbon protein
MTNTAPACIHSATLTKLYRRAVRFKGSGWFPVSKNRKTNIALTINYRKIFLKYFDI